MSLKLMNLVWEVESGALTTAQRLLLLALADAASDEGVCWPQVGTLAQKVDLSERQVRTHLDALETAGWFGRHRRVRGWRATGYQYEIVVDKLVEHRKNPVSSDRKVSSTSSGRCLPVSERKVPAGQERKVSSGHIQNRNRGTTKGEPSTTAAGSQRVNQFDGVCALCDCVVPAGTGTLVGKKPRHLPGQCAGLVDTTTLTNREDWK